MMETTLTIQALLFKWIRHHGTRSIHQIKIACKNLNESFSTGIKYPIFVFFVPLVRKGYIEFIGHGKYQPGPPVIVFNKDEKISTALNLKDAQFEYIHKNAVEVEKLDLFGTLRFKSHFENLKKICKNLNVDYIDNNIVPVLSEFPKLLDVILQYKKVPAPICDYHFDIFHHSWKNIGREFRMGIHKSTKDAQQYFFRMNKEVWFKIPGYEINPDSRFICESYQALVGEKHPFIFYNKIEKLLTIQTISIPILVERALRVPSLHMGHRVFNNKEQVYKNIGISAFRQLNRIFSNGIKIL